MEGGRKRVRYKEEAGRKCDIKKTRRGRERHSWQGVRERERKV